MTTGLLHTVTISNRFNQLQIPVLAFQETDVYDIHRARTTGERSFRNSGSRNDWVWVAYSTSNEYGPLRGKLPGKLRGLFKIRDTGNDGKVYRLGIVQLLQASQNGGGRIADAHGLVRVFAKRQRVKPNTGLWTSRRLLARRISSRMAMEGGW